ncbi:MAG: hypothetical protein JXN61_09005 [Sedimentisphaerales bacterium]|nr:hypothetical protein [Sedimentisphaerales bacterium]
MRKSLHAHKYLTGFGLYIMAGILLLTGCESMRFGVDESQKENAWLHNRTAAAAAQVAEAQETTAELQGLTELSELQSQAFTAYFGLPKQYPAAETVNDILSESNRQLASKAIGVSEAQADPWSAADTALDLGIGICAILGGVYGTKAAKFLEEAKTKYKALKEIITGNELFKKANQAQIEAFKQAHANQSPETKQIVTQIKG